MIVTVIQPSREVYYPNNTYKVVGKASMYDLLMLKLSAIGEKLFEIIDSLIPEQKIIPPDYRMPPNAWRGRGYALN